MKNKPQTLQQVQGKTLEELLEEFDNQCKDEWENQCCGCPDSIAGISSIKAFIKKVYEAGQYDALSPVDRMLSGYKNTKSK